MNTLDLGMNRLIDRRDFLNGVAIGVTAGLSAFASAQAQSAAAENDPPLRTGLRGNYPAAIDEFDGIRQGKYVQPSLSDADLREEYDLVIVGGGISGLSAAYFIAPRWGRMRRF